MTVRPRIAVVVAALVATLAGGFTAGCSSDSGGLNCSLSSCTVTLNRGVDAKASVFGVDVVLVNATDNQVTVSVAGNNINLATGGAQTQAAGLNIQLQSVTKDQVVLEITKA